jgi:iron only hydrogenase large subunit-like protein
VGISVTDTLSCIPCISCPLFEAYEKSTDTSVDHSVNSQDVQLNGIHMSCNVVVCNVSAFI